MALLGQRKLTDPKWRVLSKTGHFSNLRDEVGERVMLTLLKTLSIISEMVEYLVCLTSLAVLLPALYFVAIGEGAGTQ